MVVGASLSIEAQTIHVAVASNFSHPMKKLVTEFEKRTQYQVVVSLGSSGKFYGQIKQGAPYEIFFSVDQAKPNALLNEGLAVVNSRFTYAIGRLALWSTHPEFFNQLKTRLINGKFTRLAIANPKLAPYGTAAMHVLENLGLVKQTQSKWIRGENISQVYQFVHSGNVDFGFVAFSQLLMNKDQQAEAYWLVPDPMHQPIKQDVVLLNKGAQSLGAHAFLDFMHSDLAKRIIGQYGYMLPKKETKVKVK